MKTVQRISKKENLISKLWLDWKSAYLNYIEGRRTYLQEIEDAEQLLFSAVPNSKYKNSTDAATALIVQNYLDRTKFDKAMKSLGFTSLQIARRERAYRVQVGKKMLIANNASYKHSGHSNATDTSPMVNIGGALMAGSVDINGNLYGCAPIGGTND